MHQALSLCLCLLLFNVHRPKYTYLGSALRNLLAETMFQGFCGHFLVLLSVFEGLRSLRWVFFRFSAPHVWIWARSLLRHRLFWFVSAFNNTLCVVYGCFCVTFTLLADLTYLRFFTIKRWLYLWCVRVLINPHKCRLAWVVRFFRHFFLWNWIWSATISFRNYIV